MYRKPSGVIILILSFNVQGNELTEVNLQIIIRKLLAIFYKIKFYETVFIKLFLCVEKNAVNILRQNS